MAIEHPIPVDVLRQLLRLDAETGRLYWLQRPASMFSSAGFGGAAGEAARWNGKWAGREALAADSGQGYRCGRIFDHRYQAHRVVFALYHGRWPRMEIDHINGCGVDNRPQNLREATSAQNKRNTLGKRNLSRKTSAFCGVSWNKRASKWAAKCRDEQGANKYLGYFTDEISAARAYDVAAREWHGEFARLNFPEENG